LILFLSRGCAKRQGSQGSRGRGARSAIIRTRVQGEVLTGQPQIEVVVDSLYLFADWQYLRWESTESRFDRIWRNRPMRSAFDYPIMSTSSPNNPDRP
jgi:hypothetical protein